MVSFSLVALLLLVVSGSSKATSKDSDSRLRREADGTSSPEYPETTYPPRFGATTYYGGPPLRYYGSQEANSGMGRTTKCRTKYDSRPTRAPQFGSAKLQHARGNHSRGPPDDYLQRLQFVGLQVADTAVEVPRLHGAVWGHPTLTTGVGPMEHHEENGNTVPHLVPTAQAVWMTNRHLPKHPDAGNPPTSLQQPSYENRKYMAFTPTENKPIGTVPIKITDTNGRADILYLPIMPNLILQSLPGSSSTYMFHHVAWLFWPAPGQGTQHEVRSQRVQMAQRYTNGRH